jgi:nitrile hydratase
MSDFHNPYDHGPHHHPAGPASEYEILARAIRELLIEKGVVPAEALRNSREFQDSRTPEPAARIVARSWVDPEFKALALRDSRAAAAKLGIDVGMFDLDILENTAERHHVVVCTLCSCFHSQVLGDAPAWYKEREYRSRVAINPRAVLAEFGTVIPDEKEVRVVDSTAEVRFMVMPERPAGTEHMSEEELAKLITQESMIGVARLAPPESG